MKNAIRVRGFTRVAIGRDGEIVGDSGLMGPNTIVNEGFQDYICKLVGKLAGSKQVEFIGLGTGTAPNATHNTLNGETGTRKAANNSVVSSKTMRATAAWASGDHPGGTPTMQNIGLFNTSGGGSLLCGNTYNTSQWQSNQGLSATYELQFS